ncbi:MAG: PepSY-like domain-containing protein [Dysgonomonas sp.]|nr:PepSY-like domain-containing protein [Prevotella sp.]
MMKMYIFFLFLFLNCTTNLSASLPDKIQNFLDKHFINNEIEKLKYDEKEEEYKIKYKNGIKIEFDRNGWVEIESGYTPLPKSIIDILPTPTIDFIAKKYPRKPIVKIKRKPDGFKVKLEGSIELKFDRRGNILKISD